ncbi:MAG: helix-turn-helix transcriptional regulator [Pseudomonadota bacterium]
MTKVTKPRAGEADILIGQRLEQIRKAKGLSMSEVGQPIGVSYQQVQKYERGVNRISATRLQQFMEILEVPWSYFFDGLPHQTDTFLTALNEVPSSGKVGKLWKGIPDDDVRLALFFLMKTINQSPPEATK